VYRFTSRNYGITHYKAYKKHVLTRVPDELSLHICIREVSILKVTGTPITLTGVFRAQENAEPLS